jgi:hypothetical protein
MLKLMKVSRPMGYGMSMEKTALPFWSTVRKPVAGTVAILSPVGFQKALPRTD